MINIQYTQYFLRQLQNCREIEKEYLLVNISLSWHMYEWK